MNTLLRAPLLGTAILASAGLVACTPPSLVREHTDFATHCASIKRVAVAVPNVEMYLLHLGGTAEPMTARMQGIAAELLPLIQAELGKRGFEAVPLQRSGSAVPDPEALFRDATIARLYGVISKEMYGTPLSPTEAKAVECKLGDEAKDLATAARSEGLLFVRFGGYRRTGGSVAAELALAVLLNRAAVASRQPTGGGVLELALVDGRTADVLWANRVQTTAYFSLPEFERDELVELTRELFKDFPKR